MTSTDAIQVGVALPFFLTFFYQSEDTLLIEKDSVIIKTFQWSFYVFMCAFCQDISSFFGKTFLFFSLLILSFYHYDLLVWFILSDSCSHDICTWVFQVEFQSTFVTGLAFVVICFLRSLRDGNDATCSRGHSHLLPRICEPPLNFCSFPVIIKTQLSSYDSYFPIQEYGESTRSSRAK